MSFSESMALIMAILAGLSLISTLFRGKRQDAASDAQMKSDVGYIKNRMDGYVNLQGEYVCGIKEP